VNEHEATVDEKTHGAVLFRNLKRMKHIYLPIDGEVQFFSVKLKQDRIDKDFERQSRRDLAMYQLIGLGELKAFYRYMGSIWCGQVAGLVEVAQEFFHREPRYVSDVERRKSEWRRSALKTTHLADLPHRWLSYGVSTHGSQIIRVPVKNFIDTFLSRTSSFGRDLFSGRETSATDILFGRMGEELAFRQAEYLSLTAYLERKEAVAVFAMHLYSFYKRTNSSVYPYATDDELAWRLGGYSGAKNTSAEIIGKLKAFGDVRKYKKPVLEFRPTVVRSIYKSVLDAGLE
jgi:hypothetical protein